MNIRDLQYLVAIADTKHFGKAAEATFVSQPALSMQIKKLENHLGVQLFERNNKNVYLTDIGKSIIEQARDILYRVDNLKELAKQSRDPFSGELYLGVIPTLGPYLLPHIIPGLTKLFPKLKIFLVEEQTQHLIAKLKQGKLDAALFVLPVLDPYFRALALFEEELSLAVHPHHPLAKKKWVRQTDLSNKVLLLLEDGHCLRDHTLSFCDKVYATANKSFQATSLETLRYMVGSKTGITLMPRLACRKNDGICYVPFRTPKPTRTLGIIWRSSSTKTQLIEHMAIQIRKLLAKLNEIKIINTPITCIPHR